MDNKEQEKLNQENVTNNSNTLINEQSNNIDDNTFKTQVIELPKTSDEQQDNSLNSPDSNQIITPPASDTPKNNSILEGESPSFEQIFNVNSEEQPENTTEQNKVETNNNVEQPIETPVQEAPIPKKSEPKKDAFNGEERLLYEIKPEKEGSPLGVFIFFLLLIGTVFSLPYISKQIKYQTVDNSTPTTEEEEEETFYYFNRSSVRATIADLELTNFVKSKVNDSYLLTFVINNTAEKAYQFDKKYYIVFYNEDAVVYRGLIYSNDAIGSMSTLEVTINITEKAYSDTNRFTLEEIATAKYPDVTVKETDGDYDILTCTYQNDEIKYYFLDNKLAKLKETYKESSESNNNYETDLTTYQALSQQYKTVTNFNSTFVISTSDFTMINEFVYKDISDNDLANLSTYKFFKYNESINVVSFEMEAQAYTCS